MMSEEEPLTDWLEHLKQPLVFKGRLKMWNCAQWTMDDWAERTRDLKLNFRIGPRVKKGEPLCEGDGVHLKATIKDLLNWTCRKECSRELQEVDPEAHFAYSSYNYMSCTFGDHREILQSVDWSCFGFPERHGADSTLWLGSAGASTPCHQDTYGCNLVAQLIGKKTWTLFPPEDSSCLYPTRLPFEESSVFSRVNFQDIDLHRYPKTEHCRPFWVTLDPGDVLFVPKMWWHLVSCFDTALSINTWIPLRSDDRSRLDEAVVRTLASALIPQYQAAGSSWINPNEALTTPGENLAYIQKVIENLAAGDRSELHDARPASHDTEKSAFRDGVPVKSYTLEEYVQRTGCNIRRPDDARLGSYTPESECFAKRVVSCFLDPEVVRVIARKLETL